MLSNILLIFNGCFAVLFSGDNSIIILSTHSRKKVYFKITQMCAKSRFSNNAQNLSDYYPNITEICMQNYRIFLAVLTFLQEAI